MLLFFRLAASENAITLVRGARTGGSDFERSRRVHFFETQDPLTPRVTFAGAVSTVRFWDRSEGSCRYYVADRRDAPAKTTTRCEI